jgi:hypothetical protein
VAGASLSGRARFWVSASFHGCGRCLGDLEHSDSKKGFSIALDKLGSRSSSRSCFDPLGQLGVWDEVFCFDLLVAQAEL